MTTQVPTKNFHNITANDNAVLHLGDIIYTYGEGGRGEGIALQQIVERLDYIIGCNDRIRNVSEAQNGELEQSNPELLHVKHTTKAPKRVFSSRLFKNEKAKYSAEFWLQPEAAHFQKRPPAMRLTILTRCKLIRRNLTTAVSLLNT